MSMPRFSDRASWSSGKPWQAFVTEQQESASRSVVIIVDDDPAIRASLAFSLQTEGIAVRLFASGAELLDSLPVAETRCLVIDYKLPGMNGLELLAELRRRDLAVPA